MSNRSVPVSLQVADWVSSIQAKKLPPPIVEAAKSALVDWMSCVIAGSTAPESSYVYAASSILGKGEDSSLFVFGGKTTSYGAALVHGTMAHAFDFDDTLMDSAVHTGASVCSAAFAVAEREEAGGERLLEGIVAGYELAGRVGKASNSVPARGSSARGFHPAGTCGVFGATAAASRIMNLDALPTARAFGIAGSFASGIREYATDGSMTKRIHPGIAASHGILSAELARRGFTGPLTVFEGPNGFLRAYSEAPRVHYLTDDFGDNFEIMKRGTKFYPCCHINHTAIDIIVSLYRDGLRADHVKAIKIWLAPAGFKIVAEPMEEKRRPATPLAAQLSLPYCVAIALVDGKITPAHFAPEQVGKQIYKEIGERVEAIADSSIDALSHWGARVKIFKKDGGILEKSLASPMQPEPGKEWPRVVAKLESVSTGIIPKESIDRVTRYVQRLEDLQRVGELGRLLASVHQDPQGLRTEFSPHFRNKQNTRSKVKR